MNQLPATEQPADPGQARPSGQTLRIALFVTIAVAVVAASVLLGYRLAGPDTPSDDSPEAGFARDMQTHHNQAVQMSFIIRGKTTDPVLQTMSYDIITTQQQQSGQMYAWLTQWGLPQTSSQPPMAWMKGADKTPRDTRAGESMQMPGMASPDEIAALQDSTGEKAEILFLELMIDHHRAGVTMAKAIQARTDRPEVLTLAAAMATAQTAEIKQMTALLRDRRP